MAMSFAQLTYRESLRAIEVNLRAQAKRLHHMGFRCATISRNTLANANATRPWQIYADFAQHLIGIARPLYANEPLALDLDATVYAFDATTIDLCLSVYPWAPFRSSKAAIKLHTLLDLRGSIPSFIHITDGKTHEVNVLDDLMMEPGAFYLMDRGYLDFARLFVIHQAQAFFVTRAKSNTHFKRRYSHPVDRATTPVICDQTGVLTVFYSSKDYPATLRRVVVKDEAGKRITFLTNNFVLKPELIAQLYRQRWQVELFFKFWHPRTERELAHPLRLYRHTAGWAWRVLCTGPALKFKVSYAFKKAVHAHGMDSLVARRSGQKPLQSILMLAVFITLDQRSKSLAITFANSSGDPLAGSVAMVLSLFLKS